MYLERDLEAYNLIRHALSIKYSKTLDKYFKEIEQKLQMKIDNNISSNNSQEDNDINSTNIILSNNSNSLEIKSNGGKHKKNINNNTTNKSSFIITSIIKLLKIVFSNLKNLTKKYRIFLIVIGLVYTFLMRHKIKTNLFKLLDFIQF